MIHEIHAVAELKAEIITAGTATRFIIILPLYERWARVLESARTNNICHLAQQALAERYAVRTKDLVDAPDVLVVEAQASAPLAPSQDTQ